MSHTVTYRIHSFDQPEPLRRISVPNTLEQVRHLVEQGYLIQERLIQGERLAQWRAAAGDVAAEFGEAAGASENRSRQFGGLFVRNLMDKHPAFLELLRFEPLLALARAVLGPQVQVHATVLRVTYPGQENQETHWHFHQRVIPEPLPPLFPRPHVIDNLIYLDDLDEATGPLCVVPGSHQRIHEELPPNDYSERPNQVKALVPAGSVITADAALWHRAMPTRPDGSVRRLIILGFSPTWMKQVDRPGGGFTDALRENADLETRELLGLAGWY